eukprot:m.53297 g.53297  ORF g.53297 m.53297 type:complete len:144 (-) comp13549_c0_seq2:148-579(-)
MVDNVAELKELKVALQACGNREHLETVLLKLCRADDDALQTFVSYRDANSLSDDSRDRSLTMAVAQTDKRLELKKRKSAKEFAGHRLMAKKWKPRATCDVCGLVMKGGFLKKHGFECITCQKKVHGKCRAKLGDCPLPDFADV